MDRIRTPRRLLKLKFKGKKKDYRHWKSEKGWQEVEAEK
jgi:hypothetical protein